MSQSGALLTDYFRLQDIVGAVQNEADEAASKAAKKVREETEKRLIATLRQRYGGQTLYCYDESHENRFAHKPLCEWNAVALSFKDCVDKMRPHIFRYKSEEQWARIERQLEAYQDPATHPSLEPEQRVVFQAGNYWYCFFCIDGEEYCDKIVAHLANKRKEDAQRAGRSCSCCSAD